MILLIKCCFFHILITFFVIGPFVLPIYARSPLPQQTDVDRAVHLVGDDGVPQLRIKGIGTHYNPAWVALYALAYAGIETYDDTVGTKPDAAHFKACIDWLVDNLVEDSSGGLAWTYDFDNIYNDVAIEAPWTSAFAQATGIQALIASYRRTGNQTHLRLAEEAALPLFRSIQNGGLLFNRADDVWFEEVPNSTDNPSHVLNGHMRALLALHELAEETGKLEYSTWFGRGLKTLERWLPLYDTSYCLKYDLNPRKSDLLFRFANPFGFTSYPVVIDRITLRDPESKKEIFIDVGATGDSEGSTRIGGIHWGPPEELDGGRSVRRLVPAAMEYDPTIPTGGMTGPHSYFYLNLPSDWDGNLRSDWYELEIEYLDDVRSNLTVQMRSISPGPAFRDLRDGDLMFSNSGHWRKWIIPVRVSDLGYWVGLSYAEKHASYLRQLAVYAPELEPWAQLARGYHRLATSPSEELQLIDTKGVEFPKQTPMLPIYSLDANGVLMQSRASSASRFLPNGIFDGTSDRGTPVYSPFIIADQVLNGSSIQGGAFSKIDRSLIKRTSALHWFLDTANQHRTDDSVVYDFQFDNTYNNIVTDAPWGSAFSQAYVLRAFRYAREEMAAKSSVDPLLPDVIRSFARPVAHGGLSSWDRAGNIFFEEVPNATHVLNAHLISIAELHDITMEVRNDVAMDLVSGGISTLHNLLWRFDSGYWLKYDQNPKKEILVQIDWLGGEGSPAIDEILLENPMNGTAVRVDVGGDEDFVSMGARISGTDWLGVKKIDGRTVRSFRDGNVQRKEPIPGGSRHNVFFFGLLPEASVVDFFDLLPYRLVFRYKDEKIGRFNIKIQSISQGNYLEFVPLRGGVLQTTGDHKWKEAVFNLRQQDLGWYKGPDYQSYEVQQLQRIANQSNDWFLYQYADRHRDFLAFQHEGQSAIGPWYRIAAKETVKSVGGIRMLRASPTYPAHGFENALDGDSYDDYVAGIEGEKQAWVVLKWHHLENISGVRIFWENRFNFAGRVRVYSVKSNGESGDIVGTFTNKDGLESTLTFDEPHLLDGLRLEFDRFSGQPRLLMRQLTVLTYDDDVSQGDFLSGNDDRNPLKIFRLPVTANIKRLSDSLVIGVESEYEMITHFMDYIAQFRIGVASAATPDNTVTERIGACGSFSSTLLALAAAQGLQGRFVGLYNYPENDGHVVVEIFIQGDWHLYDPTYGAYYVSPENGTGRPLSFKALQRGYRAGDPIEPVITVPRRGRDDFTGRDIFVQAEPAGIIGPDKPMIFPLDLVYGVTESLTDSNMGARNQGASYIGAAGVNQQQRWALHGLVPGESYTFTITPKSLDRHLQENESTFKLYAEIIGATPMGQLQNIFYFKKTEAAPWNIQFIANAPTVTVRLSHPYLGPKNKYIRIKRYDLKRNQ